MPGKKTSKPSSNSTINSSPDNRNFKSAGYNFSSRNNATPSKLDSSPNSTPKRWSKFCNPIPSYKKGKNNNTFRNKNKLTKEKDKSNKGKEFKPNRKRSKKISSKRKEGESGKSTKNSNSKLKKVCLKSYSPRKKISSESKNNGRKN